VLVLARIRLCVLLSEIAVPPSCPVSVKVLAIGNDIVKVVATAAVGSMSTLPETLTPAPIRVYWQE